MSPSIVTPRSTTCLDYCRHSADPVGELVLRLHRVWTPERGKWSDAICTALQLANFWQDVTVDARKDRIYAPLRILPPPV
jgi:phytoene/squalene synthetase